MYIGYWILEGSSPPLYTRKAADEIVHTPTGKRYKRGEYTYGKERHATVEETGEYKFIYPRKQDNGNATMSDNDYLREMYVRGGFKK